MEQIDALRAMLADATPGEWKWVEYARCTPGEKYAVGTNDVAIGKLPREQDARLIAAMHNALPALLDAAEMVEVMDEIALAMNCGAYAIEQKHPHGTYLFDLFGNTKEIAYVKAAERLRTFADRIRAYQERVNRK